MGTALIYGCKKGESGVSTPEVSAYINAKAGSTWSYHEVNTSSGTPKNSDYSILSTTRDTSINSKSYHIYTYSFGGSQYLALSGHDYYQFDSVESAIIIFVG